MCSSLQGGEEDGGSFAPGRARVSSGNNNTQNRTGSKIQNVISLRRRTIYVLYFMAFLDLLAVSLFLPLLSSGMRSLGASPFMAGLIGSSYGAIQLFSSPAWGWGSDKYGQKFVLIVSLVASSCAYLLQGISINILMMFFARILAGLFKHTQTIGKSIVSELSSKDKSYVIGNFNAFGSMGFILGPTLGAHIAQLDNGFQLVSYLSASAFILNAILLLFLVPEPSKLIKTPNPSSPRRGDSDTSVWSMLRNSDVHSVLLLVVRFLFSFATLVFRENLTIVMLEKYNSDLVNSGYLTSLQALMSTLLGFAVGPVNAFLFKGNSLYMVLITGIFKTAVLLTLFWSQSYWLAASMLVAVSAVNPFLRVGITAVSLEGHHDDLGTILGLGQTATSLARMISPTAAGLAMTVSHDGPFLLAAGSSFVSIFATLLAQRYAKSAIHKKND